MKVVLLFAVVTSFLVRVDPNVIAARNGGTIKGLFGGKQVS